MEKYRAVEEASYQSSLSKNQYGLCRIQNSQWNHLKSMKGIIKRHISKNQNLSVNKCKKKTDMKMQF